MRGRIALLKHFVRNPNTGMNCFAEAFGARTPVRIGLACSRSGEGNHIHSHVTTTETDRRL
jgi:hypothetical protein